MDSATLAPTRTDVSGASYWLYGEHNESKGALDDSDIDAVFECFRGYKRTRPRKEVVWASITVRYRFGRQDGITLFSGGQAYVNSRCYHVDTRSLVRKLLDNGTFRDTPRAFDRLEPDLDLSEVKTDAPSDDGPQQ